MTSRRAHRQKQQLDNYMTKTIKTAAVKTAKKPVKTEAAVAEPEVRDFNGHPMLCFEPQKEEFPFQMGLRKLKLILPHFEAVRRFVESEGAEC
jgi:hypothetical protein